MNDLRARLSCAPRAAVLTFAAVAIHELTVLARGDYDDKDGNARMRAINEAIHSLSGHLIAVLDSSEALSESRLASIAEATCVMPDAQIERVERWSNLAG